MKKMKKAIIKMVVDGREYLYGSYPYNTRVEKIHVNNIAKWIKEERRVETFICEMEE